MWNSIKKEFMEGVRTYRFLAILSVMLFFAFLDPALQKYVIPNVLMAQFGDTQPEIIDQMLITTQRACIRTYYTNIFQVGTLVTAFVLSGVVAGERKNRTMIIPIGNGIGMEDAVMAKAVVNGVYLLLVNPLIAVVEYYYTGALFGFDLSLLPAIRSGCYYGIYFTMIMAIVLFAGTFFRSGMVAAMVALIPSFGIHLVSQLLNVSKYTPSGLINEAAMLSVIARRNVLLPMAVTMVLILVLIGYTIFRMERIELASR